MASSTAIIAYEDKPTQEVAKILRNIVTERTEKGYATNNAALILWLYDDESMRENLLKDWMVELLHQAKESGRKAMKKACHEAFNQMDRTNDQSPIVLEKMTFDILSHYISTRKRMKNENYLSASNYGKIRSSLTHMFRRSGQDMNKDLEKNLTESMKGLKKTAAAENGKRENRL